MVLPRSLRQRKNKVVMTESRHINFPLIREAMGRFEPSPKVEPNEEIKLERVFFPNGHRGILDLKRQLVVANRGMGKSFWTHALKNEELRSRLAKHYTLPSLAQTQVVIGFNGSDKQHDVAPSIDEVTEAVEKGYSADAVWRATLLRAVYSLRRHENNLDFAHAMTEVTESASQYSRALTVADNELAREGKSLLVVFDALDRLAEGWEGIRQLTKGLLVRTLGLQSFRAIRAKIFMRVDQFADQELFNFPDSSKLKNDHVDLIWRPHELYGLLLFEILRERAKSELENLADQTQTREVLPIDGSIDMSSIDKQRKLVSAIAGEYMGSHKTRGSVYTWVPLHLSDAADTCSPRTFLTAWKRAAEFVPPVKDKIPLPKDKAVDYRGLIDGVRKASKDRLVELLEDYRWINPALEVLRQKFVPMPRDDLFMLWEKGDVLRSILANEKSDVRDVPVGIHDFKRFQDASTSDGKYLCYGG